MKENILVVHGGAPTAVMNASLYGVIREAEKYPNIDHIYAAIGGSGGILKEHFLDLKTIEKDKIESLPYTPASAIGTSRDALEKEDYEQIADVIQKNKIRYVFMNGGNGSMDTCGKIYHACKEKKYDVIVVGIPKTIDNDLAITDHSPGFGSAAYPLTVESIEKNLNDIAGVRVICSHPADIYKLSEAFLRQDDITLLERKDYIANPKPNGYRSLHLIVETPIFLHDQKRLMKVEVQFRTISMDWWASLEHKIRYKKNLPEMEYVERELYECAEISAQLDARMEKLQKIAAQATEGKDRALSS